MGHAIHSDLSKKQESIYQDYPISVAEVASTFFENVLLDNLLEIASPEEKRDLLVNKVQDNVFTIFAQIAYFQYEKNIHKAVKEKGYLSKEEFASMFAECRKSYVGDSVEVVETDGYGYVYINHFRYFFYVYSYAYGQLIANAMYEEYKKDKSFGAKIKKFLSAGGSATPEDIFKSIGIDTSKPDFFLKGLKKIEKDLDAVEGMF
jgi:oligoendopeptidase F